MKALRSEAFGNLTEEEADFNRRTWGWNGLSWGREHQGKRLKWDQVPPLLLQGSSLCLSLSLSGLPPQALPAAAPGPERRGPAPGGGGGPESPRAAPPHPGLHCPTGGPGSQRPPHLQEPPGPAQRGPRREAQAHSRQPAPLAQPRAASGQRQVERTCRGQPRRRQWPGGRQDALEVLLAGRECQDDPGEAGKSV